MIEKTIGIVVKATKFSETSLIVKVFTEAFGMRTYMVRGVRKKKSRTPINLFQPLSILDMVVYEKPGRDIQNIKEIKAGYFYSSIPYEISKSSIVIFLNELVFKSVKEEEPNPKLFQFIYHSLVYLDEVESGYQDFHLSFMLLLTRHLGFAPSTNFLPNQEIFDLQEGRYTSLKLTEAITINMPLSKYFFILSQNINYSKQVNISRIERQVLIEKILIYYQLHLPSFSEMKSFDVLSEVLG